MENEKNKGVVLLPRLAIFSKKNGQNGEIVLY